MESNQIRDYIQYLNPEAYNRLKQAGTLEFKVKQLQSRLFSREVDIRDKLAEQLEQTEEYKKAQETDFLALARMTMQLPLIAEEMVRAEAEEIIKAL